MVNVNKNSCPTSWQNSELLDGRFLIGAGNSNLDSKSNPLSIRNVGESTSYEYTTRVPASTDNSTTEIPSPDRVLAALTGPFYSNYSGTETLNEHYPGGYKDSNMPPYYTTEICDVKDSSPRLTSGMIIAFNQGGCPTGWSKFSQGAGRFLLGAGSGNTDIEGNPLNARTFGLASGLEYTTGILSILEASIAEVTNSIPQNLDYAGRRGTFSVPSLYAEPDLQNMTTLYGEKADSNMPPYVVVQFCIKD